MIFEGQHKFYFLTGEIPLPQLGDPHECLWKREDSPIWSMLINSMEPQIGKPLLNASTVKDIWDTTQKLYSKYHSASCLYELRTRVHGCM